MNPLRQKITVIGFQTSSEQVLSKDGTQTQKASAYSHGDVLRSLHSFGLENSNLITYITRFVCGDFVSLSGRR
jgi:hypothetical protein